jgi:DNA-binding beta-propeller fold protein YncE
MRATVFCLSLLIAAPSAWAFDSIQLKKIINAPAAAKKFAPAALALGPHNELWVVDSTSDQLLVFSSSGDFVNKVGQRGNLPGQLSGLHGIAVDSDGSVYVTEAGNHRVHRFSAEGKSLATFGEKGSEAGQLQTPWTIALSRDGVLIVGEKDSGRIELFTREGLYLKGFATGAAVDGLVVDAVGRIYVSHAKLQSVEQWSNDGQRLKTWTGQEPGVKPFERPTELAVNLSGILYVNDPDAHRFRELDLSGHTLGSFGRKGSGDGQFRSLSGLSVDGETLYLGDAKLHRISVFGVSHTAPAMPLTSMPLSRLQIARRGVIPADVDRMAVAADNSLYALSATHDSLLHLDAQGKTLDTIPLKKGLGIRNASGLAIAPASGSLFVADAGTNRVLKLDRGGKPLLEFGKGKHFFKGSEGELSGPQGVSCSPQGALFVTDTGNARFQVFNHQGLFQFAGGSKGNLPGQLRTPVDIAWDHERVIVVDSGNKKVSLFSPSGAFQHDLATPPGEIFSDPKQAVVDRESNVFVLDAERGRILCFDAQGEWLGAFGRSGKTGGGFDHPRALALAENGDLFVAQAGHVETLHVTILPPAPERVLAMPGEGFVSLQWAAVKSRYPVKYVVYRNAPGAEPQRVKETVETSVTDDSLTPGTTYSFTVMAESAQGVVGAPSKPVLSSAAPVTGPRLEIVSAEIEDVFSAHYKYYSRVPFGHVKIRNNGQGPVEKLKVSFAIQGYMDYPTETSIDALHAGEEKEVPLLATFNNRILEVTETTPIQAQLTCSFYSGDHETSFVRHLPFKLFSRNTIRWDKKDRLSAFITPNDPSIIDFARGVVTPFAEQHRGAPVPVPILNAWALFEGLGTYGISYSPRPNNPYGHVSLDSSTIDTLQFARETLARKSGDCADVVTLVASMLESMTVTTAALDAPGHLFLMFDTGETDKDALGFPDSMVVSYAGSYWIPVEATMLGSPFLEAWRQGAEEYRKYSQQGKLRPIDVHVAWRTFEPATLPEMAVGVKAPERDAVETKFLADWKALVELRWQTSVKRLKEASAKEPDQWLQLGLLAVDFRRYDDAKEFLKKAAAEKTTSAAAYNNLGNLALLQGDAVGAQKAYEQAMQIDGADAQICVNLARAYLKQKNPSKAAEIFERAAHLDAGLRETYPDVSSLAL